MRIAYLILAHKNPGQLKRLVGRLHGENITIYIHLDKKAVNVWEYNEIVEDYSNVHFIQKRIEVNWGAYSMIEATLNSLKEIVAAGLNYDYINLLSGQDYPIKNKDYIINYFASNYGREFLYFRAHPTPDIPEGGEERINYYYNFDNIYTASDSGNKDIYEREMRVRGIKKEFIKGMKPYHGSQWWSLTGKCVKYILETVNNNYEIINFYRYSKIPDEQFFQTVIMNSRFADNVLNDTLWYLDWSQISYINEKWALNTLHPKTLSVKDFDMLAASQYLYARKFDDSSDSKILDLIDTHLL